MLKDNSFRAFESRVSFHSLIASLSEVNTKCENCDGPVQCLLIACKSAAAWFWFESRLRFIPPLAECCGCCCSPTSHVVSAGLHSFGAAKAAHALIFFASVIENLFEILHLPICIASLAIYTGQKLNMILHSNVLR